MIIKDLYQETIFILIYSSKLYMLNQDLTTKRFEIKQSNPRTTNYSESLQLPRKTSHCIFRMLTSTHSRHMETRAKNFTLALLNLQSVTTESLA